MSLLPRSVRALAPFRLRLAAAGAATARAAPVRHIASASALPARRVVPAVAVAVRPRCGITASATLRSEVMDTEEALANLGDLFGEARMEIEVPSGPFPSPTRPPARPPPQPRTGRALRSRPSTSSLILSSWMDAMDTHIPASCWIGCCTNSTHSAGCARLGGDHVLQRRRRAVPRARGVRECYNAATFIPRELSPCCCHPTEAAAAVPGRGAAPNLTATCPPAWLRLFAVFCAARGTGRC